MECFMEVILCMRLTEKKKVVGIINLIIIKTLYIIYRICITLINNKYFAKACQ